MPKCVVIWTQDHNAGRQHYSKVQVEISAGHILKPQSCQFCRLYSPNEVCAAWSAGKIVLPFHASQLTADNHLLATGSCRQSHVSQINTEHPWAKMHIQCVRSRSSSPQAASLTNWLIITTLSLSRQVRWQDIRDLKVAQHRLAKHLISVFIVWDTICV